VFQWNSYLCVLVGETEERKYILSLSLKFVKIVCYNFPLPYDGLQNILLFYKRPVVDTEFDVPGLSLELCH
jgi:hypothetical protein